MSWGALQPGGCAGTRGCPLVPVLPPRSPCCTSPASPVLLAGDGVFLGLVWSSEAGQSLTPPTPALHARVAGVELVSALPEQGPFLWSAVLESPV